MASTTTSISTPDAVPADPNKRVNYTFGMVLGVADFVQMDAYREARDRLLARELIGYGTVWGLAVGTDTDAEGRDRVTVSRGLAIMPAGQPVCVPVDQCAYVGSWLQTHAESINDVMHGAGDLPAYVVLCHRERKTDNVPIPGEPCRSEDELMAPSRLQDDFSLEIRLMPPRQVAEDAIRDVVDWLRQIPVIPGPGSSVDDVLDELRAAAAAPTGSPPDVDGSPPDGWGSPPTLDALLGSPSSSLAIPAGFAPDYLRAIFRVWTTELRPRWRTEIGYAGDECLPDGAGDNGCVLLAELSIPIMWEAGNPSPILTNPIEIIESRRPFLLQERMLQEWLLTTESGSLWGSPPELGGGGAGGVMVAAGRAGPLGGLTTPPQFGSAGVAVNRLGTGIYRLTFPGYDASRQYVVSGSPVTSVVDAPRLLETVVDAGGFSPPLDASLGLHIRISSVTGTAVDSPFSFQVIDYSAAP